MSNSDYLENLKEFTPIEFELVFVDSIYKKLKSIVDQKSVKSEMILLIIFSVAETLKKYKLLAEESSREILHKPILELILTKCENYLSSVADDTDKASYAYQSVSDIYEVVKELVLLIKSELVDTPSYNHLKINDSQ